ncbi:MAG: 50S ribosomal protein L9 [Flavobacteriales bacterium]|nr:50S ribosomal protein L9 [Flavobacteriales bacterium]
MEIILKQEVENLGSKDEIVVVKPGYARNYLIPNGYAIPATASNKKILAENLKQRAHKEAKLLEEANKTAAAISSLVIKIGAKAGENDKIFGSVNSLQLAEGFAKAGFNIDRKQITLLNSDNIKTLGTYKAKVKLHKEVSVEVDFEVVSE